MTPSLSIQDKIQRLDLYLFKLAEDIIATLGDCLPGCPHTPVVHRQNPEDFIDKLVQGLNLLINVHQPTRLDSYGDVAADYLPGHTPGDMYLQYRTRKNEAEKENDINHERTQILRRVSDPSQVTRSS